MEVFVAGATVVIGIPLVKRLVADGHHVTGMTRTARKRRLLQELDVEPVVCDVYDTAALEGAVVGSTPDVVIHELTDLPDDLADLDGSLARNTRMRREGTANLLAAAEEADVDSSSHNASHGTCPATAVPRSPSTSAPSSAREEWSCATACCTDQAPTAVTNLRRHHVCTSTTRPAVPSRR